MKAAIHQPNFLPWLGLFHRISQVECFIFFDHVQAPRGKSWLSRNKILLDGEVRWLTIPTRKSGRQFQRVDEVEINRGTNFVRKHLGTLRQAYGKAPHFGDVMPMLEDLYESTERELGVFNARFIRTVCEKLEIGVEFRSSAEIVAGRPELADLKGNAIVLELCKAAGVTHYVSGTGCLDFIEPDAFGGEGIGFEFQQFEHPEYPQTGCDQFTSHLSVVDALCQLGYEGARASLT